MRSARAMLGAALVACAVPAAAQGAAAPVTVRVDSIACRSRCGPGGAVAPGGLVRLSGEGLATAARVLFAGGPSAPAVRARPGRADVRVPGGVLTGPLRVAAAGGAVSGPSAAPLRVAAVPARAKLSAHVTASLAAPRVVFGAPPGAQLRYTVTDPRPVQVAVDVVRVPDGMPLATWPAATVSPGVEQVVTWDGLGGGRVPRAGTYELRVFAGPAGAGPDATAPFEFVPNVFPVAGPHQLLLGAGRFGAPRPGGRVHEGQDVAAACGTPLVATRAGIVKDAGAEARAGNYLVLDMDSTGWDAAYMHLREAPLVGEGVRVLTGQVLGYVGDTGDADGCHLHLELWTSPGWHTGGDPVDPLRSLVAWDG